MRLNHVLVLTTDIDVSTHFWCEVIGLSVGYRPPFPFPGIWLYGVEDAPLIHVAISAHVPPGGAIDHVALSSPMEEYESVRERVINHTRGYREVTVPETGDRQIFVSGPDGLNVELLFLNR